MDPISQKRSFYLKIDPFSKKGYTFSKIWKLLSKIDTFSLKMILLVIKGYS